MGVEDRVLHLVLHVAPLMPCVECFAVLSLLRVHVSLQKMKDHISSEPVKTKLEAIKRKVSA